MEYIVQFIFGHSLHYSKDESKFVKIVKKLGMTYRILLTNLTKIVNK